jgi:archaellum biogenesis ATPase FlaH
LPTYRAGRDLLLRNEPRTIADVIQTEDTVDMSLDWALKLDNSILSIQGPPGTGKSYTASKMIIGLVRANKKVGITALSHKVITGLLEKVQKKPMNLGCKLIWYKKYLVIIMNNINGPLLLIMQL